MAKRLTAFVRLARLKFLVGGLLGGGIGTAVAAYEGVPIVGRVYFIAQGTITAVQLMTHFANDYFDRTSDALTTRTAFSGGSGVLVDGSLPPCVGLIAALGCLALGLSGIVALWTAGLALAAALAMLMTILAWVYSAPPLRLLGRGLGELDTSLVVAVLVPLSAYAAQTGVLDLRIAVSTLPAAAAMFGMMICVEYPDYDADRATDKWNLVVRAGRRKARQFVVASIVAAGVAVVVASLVGVPMYLAPTFVVGVSSGTAALWAVARADEPPSPGQATNIAALGVLFFLATSLSVAATYAAAGHPFL